MGSFSYMTEAVGMKFQTAADVARVIYKQIICLYGVPSVIISDNANNVRAKIIKTLCNMFQIKKHRPYLVTAHIPQD